MRKLAKMIGRFPVVAFVIGLAIIFAAVYGGQMMRAQEVSEGDKQVKARTVETFAVGESREIVVQGEVERADTITLVATTSGIVRRTLAEGNYVVKGQQVVLLGDSYTGESAAQVALEQTQISFDYQKEVFELQEDIYDTQEDGINKTGSDESRIAQKQIDLQERANEFALDNAKLAHESAHAQVARYTIGAPFTGTLESQFVRIGDQVSAGTPLGVLRAQNTHDALIVAYVSKARAANIDLTGETYAMVGSKKAPLQITHIAKAPTRVGAYAVTFSVSPADTELFTDGGFIEIHLQLAGEVGTQFVPLDSVRYSAEGPEIYIVKDGKAHAIPVELGEVVGSSVIVVSGIKGDDEVILDRAVSDGEIVTRISKEGSAPQNSKIQEVERLNDELLEVDINEESL